MMVALIICITIHEFAHALSAYRSGDDTPKKQGRISLNPIDHLDPLGTIMMVLSSLAHFGIGWGKPVRINPGNFRNPRWDNLKVSLWGPLSNILTAAVIGGALHLYGNEMSKSVAYFLVTITEISVMLAMFNLIPVGPLDGTHILASLLPQEQGRKYEYFMVTRGTFIFLGLIFLAPGILSKIMVPPAEYLLSLFIPIKVLLRFYAGS